MINIEITPEIFSKSKPTSCGKCVIANILKEVFPHLSFEVYPRLNFKNGTILVESQLFSQEFPITQEQNEIANNFDRFVNVTGSVVQISQQQIDTILALSPQTIVKTHQNL